MERPCYVQLNIPHYQVAIGSKYSLVVKKVEIFLASYKFQNLIATGTSTMSRIRTDLMAMIFDYQKRPIIVFGNVHTLLHSIERPQNARCFYDEQVMEQHMGLTMAYITISDVTPLNEKSAKLSNYNKTIFFTTRLKFPITSFLGNQTKTKSKYFNKVSSP